jgi:muramoyltetrapeptide carboxypeptidase
MIQYPSPLRVGDTIAVTAPSNGIVGAESLERLDTVITYLRAQGYKVLEGSCLRQHRKCASGSASERAAELMRFLCDDNISAIIPPTGGELAIETLPLLDFDYLFSARPKWMLGFSDISTILLPLTLLGGWATAHGTTLMGLPPNQRDVFASNTLNVLRTNGGESCTQNSSTHYLMPDFTTSPISFSTGLTRWKPLGMAVDDEVRMKGRLIGGCLGRVTWLVGTRYGDVPAFVAENQADGIILYLESGGLRATEFARALLSIKMNGWFDSLSGVLIGRHSAPEGQQADDLHFLDVMSSTFEGLNCPVVFDADLGHTQPQLTLINGAIADIRVAGGAAHISQRFL